MLEHALLTPTSHAAPARPLWWRFSRRTFLVGRHYLRLVRHGRPVAPPAPTAPAASLVISTGAVRVAIGATDGWMLDALARLFPGAIEPWKPDLPTAHHIAVGEPPADHDPDARTVWIDGEPTLVAPWDLMATVLARIDRFGLDAQAAWPHAHAGVPVVDGRALVLPGRSGSGKTTLTAHLAAGRGLLSDDMVAIDVAGGRLRGATRPMCFRAVEPDPVVALIQDPGAVVERETNWWAPAAAIGAVQVVEARPGAVVLPARGPGALELEPASRAEAAEVLLANAFDFPRDPAASLLAAAWLAAGSIVLRLRYQEAREAVGPLTAALADDPPPEPVIPELVPAATGRDHARRADGVDSVVLEDRAVLCHRSSRHIVRLDPAATAFWLDLDGHRPPSTVGQPLVDQLAELGFVDGVAG